MIIDSAISFHREVSICILSRLSMGSHFYIDSLQEEDTGLYGKRELSGAGVAYASKCCQYEKPKGIIIIIVNQVIDRLRVGYM